MPSVPNRTSWFAHGLDYRAGCIRPYVRWLISWSCPAAWVRGVHGTRTVFAEGDLLTNLELRLSVRFQIWEGCFDADPMLQCGLWTGVLWCQGRRYSSMRGNGGMQLIHKRDEEYHSKPIKTHEHLDRQSITAPLATRRTNNTRLWYLHTSSLSLNKIPKLWGLVYKYLVYDLWLMIWLLLSLSFALRWYCCSLDCDQSWRSTCLRRFAECHILAAAAFSRIGLSFSRAFRSSATLVLTTPRYLGIERLASRQLNL